MKYPKAYRILGVINLLVGLVMAFLFMIGINDYLTKPEKRDLSLVIILAICGLVCLWLIASSFLWFFKSRFSYSLLLITLIFVLSSMVLAFATIMMNSNANNLLMVEMTTLFHILYAGFIIFTMCYKPVKEHARAAGRLINPKVLAIFGISVLLCAGGITALNYIPVTKQVPAIGISSSGNLDKFRETNVNDNDLKTWWTPYNRFGIGSWIRIDFYPQEISGIELHPGSHYPDYPKYGDLFKKNSRLKTARLEFDNGQSITIEPADEDRVQRFSFQPVHTKMATLRIISTRRGELWNDLCVSEFHVLKIGKRFDKD